MEKVKQDSKGTHKVKAELVTKSEYARRRGCAASAVTRAIQEGRIVVMMVDGREMIDPAVADIQWSRNTRARVDSNASSPSGVDRSGQQQGDGAGSGGGSGAGEGDYWDSRTRREKAEADMAELKLQEQLGELVRTADIRTSYARRAAALREALMQIPARLAPVLAAQTDAGEIHDQIQAELRQVLEQLTEA